MLWRKTTQRLEQEINGSPELFAVVGEPESSTLWFAGSRGVEQLPMSLTAYYEGEGEHICTLSDGKKLFIMESGGFGSGSTSNCYYVTDDQVHTVAWAGEGLAHLSGDDFAIYPSAFDYYTDPATGADAGGHTWKRYYLKWTGTGFEEYIGTEISEDTLLQYSGAEEILQQAGSYGYSIGTIIARDNGIINVNLYTQTDGSRENQNLTLQVEGNQVSLVRIYDDTNDWLWSHSYGGMIRSCKRRCSGEDAGAAHPAFLFASSSSSSFR